MTPRALVHRYCHWGRPCCQHHQGRRISFWNNPKVGRDILRNVSAITPVYSASFPQKTGIFTTRELEHRDKTFKQQVAWWPVTFGQDTWTSVTVATLFHWCLWYNVVSLVEDISGSTLNNLYVNVSANKQWVNNII